MYVAHFPAMSSHYRTSSIHSYRAQFTILCKMHSTQRFLVITLLASYIAVESNSSYCPRIRWSYKQVHLVFEITYFESCCVPNSSLENWGNPFHRRRSENSIGDLVFGLFEATIKKDPNFLLRLPLCSHFYVELFYTILICFLKYPYNSVFFLNLSSLSYFVCSSFSSY